MSGLVLILSLHNLRISYPQSYPQRIRLRRCRFSVDMRGGLFGNTMRRIGLGDLLVIELLNTECS